MVRDLRKFWERTSLEGGLAMAKANLLRVAAHKSVSPANSELAHNLSEEVQSLLSAVKKDRVNGQGD